jgi:hypothetical protein
VQALTPVILATWEVEIGGTWFEACLGKKLARSYHNKPGMMVHSCNLSYAEGKGRRIEIPG